MAKRLRILLFVGMAVVGLIPLMNSFSNPRLQSLRVGDRLQLIGAGMCFGVGIGFLRGGFRDNNAS
jgi:hypothetical protein